MCNELEHVKCLSSWRALSIFFVWYLLSFLAGNRPVRWIVGTSCRSDLWASVVAWSHWNIPPTKYRQTGDSLKVSVSTLHLEINLSSWVKLFSSVSAVQGFLIPMDLINKLVCCTMERDVMFCWFHDGRRVAFLNGLCGEISASNLQVRKVKLRGRTVESRDIGRIDVNLPTVHKGHKLSEVVGLVLVDFDDDVVAKRWRLLAFLFRFLGHGRLSLSFKNQVVKDSTSGG